MVDGLPYSFLFMTSSYILRCGLVFSLSGREREVKEPSRIFSKLTERTILPGI